jgi:hypothetical protein
MKNSCQVKQLRSDLQQQYDLICFEDLADYHSQHRLIFDLFKKYYKSEYTPNERLILYSGFEPSQEFLHHIQRAATKIDISNFFIFIVTPYDLKSNLEISNQIHGNDLLPMQCLQVDIIDCKPQPAAGFFTKLDTVCPYPFMGVNVTSGYSVKPCCKFTESAGTIQHKSIQEIFDSEYFRNIRQQLLTGQQIPQCKACWNTERHNSTSLRQHGLHKFSEVFEQQWLDQPTLIDVTLTPTNLCNFACRICNHHGSSKIAAEEYVHSTSQDQKNIFQKYLHLQKNNIDKKIIDSIIDSLNTIESLHIMGGEPFIWPSLPKFLQQIIDQGHAKNIHLEFTTNASVFPANLLDQLQKFKSVEILLSIDDIHARFEIQRGGKWADIVHNVKLFKNMQNAIIRVKATPTVNIQNVLYLDQLLNFFNEYNFEIMWWYLEEPHYLSIDHVTSKVKQLVYQKYQNHNNPELRSIAQRVLASNTVNGNEFLQYASKLDQRRQQSFKDAHKEIFDAMLD